MQQTTISKSARAKINLYLHVIDKRHDGYHDLESLVTFADLADKITIAPAGSFFLNTRGEFVGDIDSINIVAKVASILGPQKGGQIELVKNIPVAGGLGGGSSDAAATFHGLNELWELGLSEQELIDKAKTLGADIPVCIHGKPCYMLGNGEKIEKLHIFPAIDMVLVNPRIMLPTSAVFKDIGTFSKLNPKKCYNFNYVEDLVEYLESTRNDLYVKSRALVPAIDEIINTLQAMDSCLLARMAGSGATCFGIFENSEKAEEAASYLSRSRPGWWVKQVKTIENTGH